MRDSVKSGNKRRVLFSGAALCGVILFGGGTADAAFSKTSTTKGTATNYVVNGNVLTVTATGEGFIYDIHLTNGNPVVSFLPGTTPPSTPGIANPNDALIHNRAYFKTTNICTTIVNMQTGTVSGSATNQQYYDPTPQTGLDDATLLSVETISFSGTWTFLPKGGQYDIVSTSTLTGQVVDSSPVQFDHLGVTVSGELLSGPAGTVFASSQPLSGLAASVPGGSGDCTFAATRFAPQGIPTVSEWGLFIFAGSIMVVGAVLVLRRNPIGI